MSYLHVPFPKQNYQRRSTKFPEQGRHLIGTFNSRWILLYVSCPAEAAIAVTAFQNFGRKKSWKFVEWNLALSYNGIIHSSDWGSRAGHEHILALAVRRSAFEALLAEETVLKEWTAEFDPFGNELERVILSLKIPPASLKSFLKDMVLRIWDITGFVRKQRYTLHVMGTEWIWLLLDWMPEGVHITFDVPVEELYKPTKDSEIKEILGLDTDFQTISYLPILEDGKNNSQNKRRG